MKTHFLILLTLALPLHLFATEVDDTTSYYDNIADSEAELNAMVQKQIDGARSEYFGCDLKIFGKRAANYLTGNLFFGAIEAQVNQSLSLDKRTIQVVDSIYHGTPYETSIIGRIAPLASVVNIAGIHLGSDKIGHFFDMGYELFNLRKEGQSIAGLVGRARHEQQGLWGLTITGVKSYGDMAANFDGYRFWQDMLGNSENPYFVCADGALKQVRAFRWSDYVTAAWNEATNCSGYSSPDYKTGIALMIAPLESRDERRYRCPIEPARCPEIRRTYSQWLSNEEVEILISPECR